MTESIVIPTLVTVAGFVATGILGGLIAVILKAYHAFNSVQEIIPVVNILLESQGVQTETLVVILEVQQGYCNGNVKEILPKIEEQRDKYRKFVESRAKIKGAVA